MIAFARSNSTLRRRISIAAAAMVWAGQGSTRVAWASPPPSSGDEAIVFIDRDAALPSRIQAELLARGFRLEATSLDEAGGGEEGSTALRTTRSGERIAVQRYMTGVGWQTRAEVELDPADPDGAALRTAELVRAVVLLAEAPFDTPDRALDTAILPAPAPMPPPAPVPVQTAPPSQATLPVPPAAPPPSRGSQPQGWSTVPVPIPTAALPAPPPPPPPPSAPAFELALQGGIAIDETGVAPALEASARGFWTERLAVGGFLRPHLYVTEVQAEAGTAELLGGHLGATGMFALTSGRELLAGVDVGLAYLLASGEPAEGFEDSKDADLGLSMAGRVELRLPRSGPLHLAVSAIGGAVVPTMDVQLAGESTATWGTPFGTLLLGGRWSSE